MNCEFCREEIDKYLEDSLPEGRRQQFENHLGTCAGCSEILRMLKIADLVMSDEKRIEPNPFLSTRIMAKLDEKELEKPFSVFKTITGRIFRPVLITVAIAVSIVLGIGIGNLSTAEYLFRQVPDEITYIDDAGIELLDIYLTE